MTREEYIHYFNHMEEENKRISLGGMAWDDIAYMIHNAIYVDKIFINHRVNIKTSIENSREKSWDNFYYALKELKNFIKTKGLYKRFKQDFINYVALFSIWHLETLKDKSFCFLYNKIRNEWWNEFGVSKRVSSGEETPVA